MSNSVNGPFRIYKRRGSNATNDGSPQTNSSGLALGDNTGAATVSRQFWIYQGTAAAGNQPLYQTGVGGVFYNGSAISIPTGSTPVIATIPAGSSIENISIILEQAPSTITSGVLTVSLDGTAVATFTIGTGIGFATWITPTTLAPLQKISMVGFTDSVLTASLAGTGILGGILLRISINYTVRNTDGSIIPYGQGLTNDGTGTTSYVGAPAPVLEAAPEVVAPEAVAPEVVAPEVTPPQE